MADVFISYSRKDRDFVLRLHEALAKANRNTWVDWDDIPLTADFLKEIYAGIEGADNFVFVISPESVGSTTCQKEIAHAAAKNKRLIPIVHRLVPDTEVPYALSGLNWIFFRGTDDFESTFASLIEVLDTDLDWKRIHTRLLQRATEWETKRRDESFLLRGTDLEQAVKWLGQGSSIRKQKPAEVHLEYIKASQEREAEELERAWRQARRRRGLLLVLGALVVVAVTTALIARRQQVTAQSRAQAAQAEQTVALDQPAALDLAIRSLQTAKTTEAKLAVAHAFPQLLAKLDHPDGVNAAAFSPDGFFIVTASKDKTARVWLAAADGELLAKLEGHTGDVLHAAFSPDSRRVVTVSADKTARVWNPFPADEEEEVSKGRLLSKFEGHNGGVYDAAFSPDGQRIITASDDHTARVWNAANGRLLATAHDPARGIYFNVFFAVFSPDGKRMVTGGEDNAARVWNAANAQLLLTLNGPNSIMRRTELQQARDAPVRLAQLRKAAFSPDGHRIVTTSTDNTARVWDAATGRLLAKLDGDVEDVAFSPDGHRIITASGHHMVRVWSADNAQPLSKFDGLTEAIMNAPFSAGGRWIVLRDDNAARLWDGANGQLVAELPGHTDTVNSAAFSPDGQRIITASDDRTARLWWVAASRQLLAKLQGHTGEVNSTAFSPDGERIVTTSDDNTVRIWDVATGRFLAKLNDDTAAAMNSPTLQPFGKILLEDEGDAAAVLHAAFSRDGQRIVTMSTDNTARVWDAASGRLRTKIKAGTTVVSGAGTSRDSSGQMLRRPERTRLSASDAVFSPDGRLVQTDCGDNTIRVWNTSTGQLLTKLEGHMDPIVHAASSPDTQRMVTTGQDGKVRVWDVRTGQLLSKLEGPPGVLYLNAAFSPDGQRLVTASWPDTAQVWDAANGQLIAKLSGFQGEQPTHAAFSPDSKRIITFGPSSTAVRIWNAETGQLLTHLDATVASAAFSPDGQRIVTVGEFGAANVYNAHTGQLLAKLGDEGVKDAAFSPDGQRIVTANNDSIARIYRLVTLSDIAELLGK